MDEFERDLIIHFTNDLIRVDSFNDRLKLKWVNRAAALLANRLNAMIGNPNKVNKEVKGYVKWKGLSPMFYNIDGEYIDVIVADVISRIHFVPTIHMDFLIMSVAMNLSDDTIQHIAKINDSLKYDDGILIGESDFPGAIIAMFAMVKRINSGKISINDARDTYRIWLKICYDEWFEIVSGGDVDDAKLTQVLEKYVFS